MPFRKDTKDAIDNWLAIRAQGPDVLRQAHGALGVDDDDDDDDDDEIADEIVEQYSADLAKAQADLHSVMDGKVYRIRRDGQELAVVPGKKGSVKLMPIEQWTH